MYRIGLAIVVGTLAVAHLGCVSPIERVPFEQDPTMACAEPQAAELEPNPIYVPWGPDFYGIVFEKVLQTLADNEFEFLETNRYDGRVETRPRVAPGLGLFWKPGSPTLYDRTLATFQSYRHRVSVIVQPAKQGGYFVEFIARKELEDLPRPQYSNVGAAIFRQQNTIERQYEVIDPTVFESNWIYQGRDVPFEQKLICDFLKALHTK